MPPPEAPIAENSEIAPTTFARVVPVAELAAGAALIVGFWTRLAAFMAFAMVANFHVARGLVFSGEFLTDGLGFPVLGARLPFSVSK